MLDERIAELIQADVDGELPPAERAELDRTLTESAEARRFHEEMRRIAHLLSAVPPVEPPAGLARRILERIALPANRGWLALGGWFRPATYGLAVATGVLIAVGIAQVVPGDAPDMQDLVGSMVSRNAALPSAAAARLDIDVPGITGEARLSVLDGARALEFEFVSARPVEVGVDLAASGLRFGGIADPGSGVQLIDFSGGEVRVVNQGSHRFVVFVRPEAGRDPAGAVGIAVRQGGETRFRGVLQAED